MIEFAISTSEFISDLQEECLHIGRAKHVVTGYPRNDALLEVSESQGQDWYRFLGGATPRHVALYAPTWRHGREPTRFFPFDDFTVGALVQELRREGVLLLLRPHARDLRYRALREMLDALAAHSDCVRVTTHEQMPDVNSFLPFVDVLITDYSALYHDFLLLDRPILFVPYDYEEFERQNGFLYDYFVNLPGPSVNTFAELCRYMSAVAAGEDQDKERRRALRDKVHTYQDAKSCERTVALLDKVGKGGVHE